MLELVFVELYRLKLQKVVFEVVEVEHHVGHVHLLLRVAVGEDVGMAYGRELQLRQELHGLGGCLHGIRS